MLKPILITVALTACGSSGAEFVGTWQLDTGPDTWSCDGVGGSTNLTGTFTIQEGVSGNLVATNPFGCTIQLTPNGDTATVVPNQSCSETIGTDPQLDTFTSGTVTLTDPNTMTMTIGGTAIGGGESCTFSFTPTLTKLSDT
jgi:hypothetical protein